MFVIANMIEALAYVLDTFLWIYFWIVIARVVVSWVSLDPWHPIVQFLYRATEPILQPVRRYLPITMGLDFSPLIVLMGVHVLRIAVVKSLYQFALSMH